jgi:hypothetical protein
MAAFHWPFSQPPRLDFTAMHSLFPVILFLIVPNLAFAPLAHPVADLAEDTSVTNGERLARGLPLLKPKWRDPTSAWSITLWIRVLWLICTIFTLKRSPAKLSIPFAEGPSSCSCTSVEPGKNNSCSRCGQHQAWVSGDFILRKGGHSDYPRCHQCDASALQGSFSVLN